MPEKFDPTIFNQLPKEEKEKVISEDEAEAYKENEIRNKEKTEQEIHDYYKNLETFYRSKETIVDFYLSKKYPDRSDFSEEEKQEVVARMEKAAEVAREKLKRMEELWAKPFGERFFHHTMLCNFHAYQGKGEAYLRGTENNQKFIAPAKSVVEKGLMSRQDLKKEDDDEVDSINKPAWQGEGSISVFDDKAGSYVESEYSTPIITYVIDPEIEKQRKILHADHGFALKNEYVIEGIVAPEYIVAAYMPRFYPKNMSQNDIAIKFMTYYNELIVSMIEHPENAFPILGGVHHYRPFDRAFPNTKEAAKELTNPERVYFGI